MRRRIIPLAVGLAALATALPQVPAHAAGTVNVRDFGAKGNGSTLDDDAIDRAITAANAAGGGVVRFPKGTYKSRTIHLRSNITLQLDSGATIRADREPPVPHLTIDNRLDAPPLAVQLDAVAPHGRVR